MQCNNKIAPHFKAAARELGCWLQENSCALMAGASNTGLMKEVGDGYAAHSGASEHFYGIALKVFESYSDALHPVLRKENVIWFDTLHERMAYFHKTAQVLVVLPGGFGTFHELMDCLVHNQLDYTKTPIILMNLDGFWDNLIAQFKHMVANKLVAAKHLDALVIVNTVHECTELLRTKNFPVLESNVAESFWR